LWEKLIQSFIYIITSGFKKTSSEAKVGY